VISNVAATKHSYRIQQWITVLAIVLLVAKLFAYFITNSVAILSDALESTVNVVAGFIGLYSLHIAAQPKDFHHPNGHGKAEFISAAIEGSLIIASALVILQQAVIKFIHQQPIQQLNTGIIITICTATLNFVAGIYCRSVGIKNQSAVLKATAAHLITDGISTVAITVGLSVVYLTHLYWIDKAVALLAGILILVNGYKIVRKSLAGIMDEVDVKLLQKVVNLLNEHRRENWIDLHNLRVIKYGNALHIDCHLTMPWYLNLQEAHEEVDYLRNIIESAFGDSVEMFVHADACITLSCSICNKQTCAERERPYHERVVWTLENIVTNKKHQLPT